MAPARYDPHVEWYEDFRPSMSDDERSALHRMLGRGSGRCLDIGCGTGIVIPELIELGWTVVGIDASEQMLSRARVLEADVRRASSDALPFDSASFDAAVSIWTHTDVEDFGALTREAARVLRPGAPFVYVGAHPCFVGPHSLFVGAQGAPILHDGYRLAGRYINAPGISSDGLRAKVGATHLPLGPFIRSFLGAGFLIECFEELGDDRMYPYVVAIGCRRVDQATPAA